MSSSGNSILNIADGSLDTSSRCVAIPRMAIAPPRRGRTFHASSVIAANINTTESPKTRIIDCSSERRIERLPQNVFRHRLQPHAERRVHESHQRDPDRGNETADHDVFGE